MNTTAMGFDELFALGEMDAFLKKAQKKCKAKLKGKNFAGMDKDDVTQEVMIKLLKSLEKYDQGVARMSTFVDHIIDNKIKDIYRTTITEKNLAVVNATQLASSDVDVEDESVESPGLTLGIIDYSYENYEFITDILENMGLSEREKEIFKLRSAGYEFVEIAGILGVSKARISQMWKGIREKYESL